MEETIIFPSPNWFQVSGLAASKNGWLVYGGPSRSLCILEPLLANECIIQGKQSYRAHVVTRAHYEKIISVDISPEWPAKCFVISGSADGSVKQWSIETAQDKLKIKSTLCHEVHAQEKEEVVGVGYSTETCAITVGSFGNVVKWDLNSNVVKSYSYFMKNFKPTCMKCSPHLPLHVGIGTKQGIVFVLDLSDLGKIVYKVRAQDDEVQNLSWCPKYEVEVKKSLIDYEKKDFLAQRLEKIRKEPEPDGSSKSDLEISGVVKTLPDDSFDNSEVVVEDDTFDIYKDHEADEFGHKKYEPRDVLVKVTGEDETKCDFLAECLKLKEEILNKKNKEQPTIQDLVKALDETHVDNNHGENKMDGGVASDNEDNSNTVESRKKDDKGNTKSESTAETVESSDHIHKHLLATIGKYGAVRIWSKSGKLVGSCAVPTIPKMQKTKIPSWTTLAWCTPKMLLLVDGKSELLECNPLEIDCKNKMKWELVHTLFKRGLFCIVPTAPRVQMCDLSEEWELWSAAQDRSLVRYSMKGRRVLSWHNTCGGFLYTLQACPYDAGRIAVSVGDGSVRVWNGGTSLKNDKSLIAGQVTSYWQNVLGKVLTVAWHPTRENLLAFATAESRVGLIDTSGKTDKPAKVLVPVLQGGVYGLCWGEGRELFASGGGELVAYQANKIEDAPRSIKVSLEGQDLQICSIQCCIHGILFGTTAGAVGLLNAAKPNALITATYVFTKVIHSTECHPNQTSQSNEESQYNNVFAVSSLDKKNIIALLRFEDKEDGSKQLNVWKSLTGHNGTVLQLAWSPHRDMLLLSSSHDATIRVWDAIESVCVSICGAHTGTTLGVAWCPYPQLDSLVISGGTDSCMRIWDMRKYPADAYEELNHETGVKKNIRRQKKKEEKPEEKPQEVESESGNPKEEQIASSLENKAKSSKKFILPITNKQINANTINGARKLLKIYLEKKSKENESHSSPDNDLTEWNLVKEIGSSGNDIVKENGSSKVESVSENGSSNLRAEKDSKVETITENGSSITEPTENDSQSPKESATDSSKVNDKQSSINKEEYDTDFIKLFGSINEINELMDKEMKRQLETGNWESWIMQCIFRGHIDTMMQFASQKDMICPYLLSIAPTVSLKYWKDSTLMYLAQLERLVARGEEEKLYESRQYGGVAYRRCAALLAVHDVRGAVAALISSNLYKEAYLLARIRYMDSIAEDTLRKWAHHGMCCGTYAVSALCFIALGNLSRAASVLSKSNNERCMSLAAELAKIVGQNALADHLEDKKDLIKNIEGEKTEIEETLEQLPSRIELLMKESDNDPKAEEE